MKNCIIVHGCSRNKEKAIDPNLRTHDGHWMPWLQEQLTKQGIPTYRPMMPKVRAPDYDVNKKIFEEYEINENTILVGMSCGTAFLVRRLSETKKKVTKLILVAPWNKTLFPENPVREKFFDYEIDPGIKDRVGEIIIFTSDNENQNGKDSLEEFHNAFGGKIIKLPNHGHYIFKHMGTEEFPEVLESILNQKD